MNDQEIRDVVVWLVEYFQLRKSLENQVKDDRRAFIVREMCEKTLAIVDAGDG